MRGGPEETNELFSYVDTEDQIAADHSVLAIRILVEEVLVGLSREFAKGSVRNLVRGAGFILGLEPVSKDDSELSPRVRTILVAAFSIHRLRG